MKRSLFIFKKGLILKSKVIRKKLILTAIMSTVLSENFLLQTLKRSSRDGPNNSMTIIL